MNHLQELTLIAEALESRGERELSVAVDRLAAMVYIANRVQVIGYKGSAKKVEELYKISSKRSIHTTVEARNELIALEVSRLPDQDAYQLGQALAYGLGEYLKEYATHDIQVKVLTKSKARELLVLMEARSSSSSKASAMHRAVLHLRKMIRSAKVKSIVMEWA
jgi:hypothetical protein